MLNGAYGTSLEPDYVAKLGRKVIAMERDFNLRAGLTPATDRLPAFFRTESLPPHGEIFDVPDEELDSVWEDDG